MTTREIARDSWREFLDSFSRQHDAWLVTVEVTGADIGAQVEGEDLRLRGITADEDGRGISIMLEPAAGEHVTHIVTAPTQVWLQQTSEGADVALQINSADGTATIVRFRSAIRPEAVDGMAAGASAPM
jgi:hypothetical protein